MQAGGVGEREDDGARDVGCHFADDLLGEGARVGGCADEDVGFDFFHDRKQVAVILTLPFAVCTRVGDLCGGELVFFALEEEAGFVDAPVRG